MGGMLRGAGSEGSLHPGIEPTDLQLANCRSTTQLTEGCVGMKPTANTWASSVLQSTLGRMYPAMCIPRCIQYGVMFHVLA